MRALLPEEVEYRDSGCYLHPSCLQCPFPLCRYDRPLGRSRSQEDRADEIRRLLASGRFTAVQIAAETGVTKRTVFRIKAEAVRA